MGTVEFGAHFMDDDKRFIPFIAIEVGKEEKRKVFTFTCDVAFGDEVNLRKFVLFCQETLAGKHGMEEFRYSKHGTPSELLK